MRNTKILTFASGKINHGQVNLSHNCDVNSEHRLLPIYLKILNTEKYYRSGCKNSILSHINIIVYIAIKLINEIEDI